MQFLLGSLVVVPASADLLKDIEAMHNQALEIAKEYAPMDNLPGSEANVNDFYSLLEEKIKTCRSEEGFSHIEKRYEETKRDIEMFVPPVAEPIAVDSLIIDTESEILKYQSEQEPTPEETNQADESTAPETELLEAQEQAAVKAQELGTQITAAQPQDSEQNKKAKIVRALVEGLKQAQVQFEAEIQAKEAVIGKALSVDVIGIERSVVTWLRAYAAQAVTIFGGVSQILFQCAMKSRSIQQFAPESDKMDALNKLWEECEQKVDEHDNAYDLKVEYVPRHAVEENKAVMQKVLNTSKSFVQEIVPEGSAQDKFVNALDSNFNSFVAGTQRLEMPDQEPVYSTFIVLAFGMAIGSLSMFIVLDHSRKRAVNLETGNRYFLA